VLGADFDDAGPAPAHTIVRQPVVAAPAPAPAPQPAGLAPSVANLFSTAGRAAQQAPPMLPPGVLPPHVLQQAQMQMYQIQQFIAGTPGGFNALPPQMKVAAAQCDAALRTHFAAVQHLQSMAHHAPAVSAPAPTQTAAVATTTSAASVAPKVEIKPVEVRAPASRPDARKDHKPKPTAESSGGAQVKIMPRPEASVTLASPAPAPAATTAPTTAATAGGNVWDARKAAQSKPVTAPPVPAPVPIKIEQRAAAPHTSQQPIRLQKVEMKEVPKAILARPVQGHLQAMPQRTGEDTITLARVLGRWVPRNAGGPYMSHDDLMKVSRMLYYNLVNAGDPFVECYYHFALQAKQAAAAAAAAKREVAGAPEEEAMHSGGGNALDAVAILTSIGNVAARKQANDKVVGASKDPKSEASSASKPEGKSAAATLASHVMSTLPTNPHKAARTTGMIADMNCCNLYQKVC
jgi:hypothetical protein